MNFRHNIDSFTEDLTDVDILKQVTKLHSATEIEFVPTDF